MIRVARAEHALVARESAISRTTWVLTVRLRCARSRRAR
ncbi:hypothetical protein DB32_006660 [Sandaracinus amylolyticus]|uniref:Uncharacterized protein n=1 Tax=Sandaracinus amylolyticus TaxID=927083 RepID=A0A0F6W7N3_9BACT|nr:hypothetical protein DB32_006659 [Sandaracinus amylolyticus]AKF09511.1 hypothetical protein DB32_006660 [Sandaracinus amylolyticus]